ncbi:transcriptional regulator [Streptomyces sp. WAC 06738]|uniref:LCP family protein n=1 Tax=Streptomyces sp. WAC 06738 TaxID=2203210 RepID=UPI000F6E8C09|nr:LCP family protein [Streptomyces sp. WAC 06738]AZM48805.1 transcriptional regulator [Streptomyces sp. WAC 06738]
MTEPYDDGDPGHRPRGRRRKAVLVAVWTLVGVMVLGGAGFTYLYFRLNGNLTSVDLDAKLGGDRPEDLPNGSTDILVLGSDSRAGDNAKYGRDGGGARSDTAMIVHVYEDRKRASVVSIPRDTLVDRPECSRDDGDTAPAAKRAMFNESYSVGGPACTVKTVEKMTGVRMDHFVEVDFSGFKRLIDQLGGVEITTRQDIDDPDSHLDLKAGTHTLDGEEALGLVRTRKGVGDGSDLGRIELQQVFVKALVQQVGQVDLHTSPGKLIGLADTATKSITTDDGLGTVNKLRRLAESLGDIGPNDMRMVTLPVTADKQDSNRVVPKEKEAAQVWKALREDRPIPKSALKGDAGGQGERDVVAAPPAPGDGLEEVAPGGGAQAAAD